MAYQYYIQRDFPYAVYPLDTLAGARSVAPLVRGTGNAQVVGGSNTASFNFPAFTNARRNRAWALEAWFRPAAGITEQVIVLGHSNYDGIIWDGTDNSIKFIMKLNNSTVTLAYYPPVMRSFHVVVAYDVTGVTMYVNGSPQESYVFAASELADTMVAASDSASLVSGVSASGTAMITIDSFATYAQKIVAAMPYTHWLLGQTDAGIIQMLSSLNATIFEVNDSKLRSAYKQSWPDTPWLSGGQNSGVSLDLSGNLTTLSTGTWQQSILLNGLTVTGSVIEFEGNATVSYSLDGGTTWTNVLSGYQVVPPNYATSGASLLIKATFSNTNQYLSSLRIKLYSDNVITGLNGNRTMTLAAPSLSSDLFYPLPYPRRGGMRSNITTINADQNGGNMSAVGFWVKVNSFTTTPQVFFDMRTSSSTSRPYFSWNGSAFVTTGFASVYIDGIAFDPTKFTAGEWHYIVLNFSAAENAVYTLCGDYTNGSPADADFAMISLFPATLTASNVSSVYNTHFNFTVLNPVDSGAISVTESATAYDLFAYDWSIISV